MRNRWLCLVRRRGAAGWSRRTSLPSSSRSERRSGRGGTRVSPPSAPSTSSSTASERAHIRAATAAPCRAPLRAATPPVHNSRTASSTDSPRATDRGGLYTRAPARRGTDTPLRRTLAPSRRRAHAQCKLVLPGLI